MVAYFSWSGNTEEMASYLAEQTGGELLEIQPETPYPTDYNECGDVALEERDSNARPAIADLPESIVERIRFMERSIFRRVQKKKCRPSFFLMVLEAITLWGHSTRRHWQNMGMRSIALIFAVEAAEAEATVPHWKCPCLRSRRIWKRSLL